MPAFPSFDDANVEAGKRDTGGPPVRGNQEVTHGQGNPETAHGRAAHATEGQDTHGRAAHATLEIRHGAYLPHWTLTSGGMYAVTYRLADSLPREVLERLVRERDALMAEAQRNPDGLTDDERQRLAHLHSERIEAYLDTGSGACWLRHPEIADLVAENLHHFGGERYQLHAWCVMPNHVHVLVEPLGIHRLSTIVQSWKSFTAKAANKRLGRSGDFWQPEYYDHMIRDEADYAHAVWYIEQNPAKAGLTNWPWVRGGTGGSPVESHAHGRAARVTE